MNMNVINFTFDTKRVDKNGGAECAMGPGVVRGGSRAREQTRLNPGVFRVRLWSADCERAACRNVVNAGGGGAGKECRPRKRY